MRALALFPDLLVEDLKEDSMDWAHDQISNIILNYFFCLSGWEWIDTK